MAFFEAMIRGTPPFVWVALALMGYRAYLNTRTRWLTLRAVLIPACVFIALGVVGASLRSSEQALAWAAAAALFLPLGYLTAPHPLAVDRGRGVMQIPGSILFGLRLIVIFVVYYGLAVVRAMHPDRGPELDLARSIFSGMVTGYYVGWSGLLLRAYRRTPAVSPRAV